jgi:tRNA(Phe) wybutosine-synthesizing methylase Tyw3
MSHKQVIAQVKTLVDAGIKDVIEALNRIPNVWTISSCEGGINEIAEIAILVGKPITHCDTLGVGYVLTGKTAVL